MAEMDLLVQEIYVRLGKSLEWIPWGEIKKDTENANRYIANAIREVRALESALKTL